jgi:arsenite methyltransferase
MVQCAGCRRWGYRSGAPARFHGRSQLEKYIGELKVDAQGLATTAKPFCRNEIDVNLNRMPEKSHTPDEKLQQEFNRWAAAGEGAKMESHHFDITSKTIRRMDLRPGERVLDLGCGSGWATRLLARLVGEGPDGFGQVIGLDVSDEMIREARAASKDFDNVLYVWGSAQQIPWEENFFDKVLSVESFYYYPNQDRALMELFRVIAPRGRLFILINLYKDNQYSLQWVDKLKVPVHVRSQEEYVELLKKHAFENVEACRIPDDTPTPDDYQTKSFHSLDDLRAFKREGALLLMASKPDLRTPAPGYTIY